METPDKTAPKTIQKKLVKSVPLKKLVKPAVAKETKKKKKEEDKPSETKPSTQHVVTPASSELASQLESLHERLDGIDKTIERLRRRTPSVFGRFLSDLAKVFLLGAILTIAWQTGWLDRFLDWAAALDLGSLGAGE